MENKELMYVIKGLENLLKTLYTASDKNRSLIDTTENKLLNLVNQITE